MSSGFGDSLFPSSGVPQFPPFPSSVPLSSSRLGVVPCEPVLVLVSLGFFVPLQDANANTSIIDNISTSNNVSDFFVILCLSLKQIFFHIIAYIYCFVNFKYHFDNAISKGLM